MARPTDFTPALGDRICDQLADGSSLRTICAAEDMPGKTTVFRWLAQAEKRDAPEQLIEFRDQYARAREAQADALADEIVNIADQPLVGVITVDKQQSVGRGEHAHLEDVTEVTTKDSVDRARLMIDARKWFAGKLNPKKYGPKIQHDGAIGLRHEDALDLLDDAAGTGGAPDTAG
jgi:disulfide oxidoreductase YuzD